ncbi:MAG: Glycosyl transferase group 1 [Candidatus Woesebacteria bacterium GW2011_GWA2_40_7]|uniref:GDP-Man:Man(1)GlcNAc(2)-PP-Dol alpha-1,3-mannosyltransferase n=3 Tax=Candidatus Woeseibacteriota TaxID=1752722 RepID=A0A0G0UU27_9BACT|nr:MAG: Glycosyl transferase group 1 [Candidatus Woesebacteria bacterium GW2011_GWB1_39_10]KKR73213.1 MAG: Glycosyl transferase group 1 [Candidatus Woesebacteria bacterium GW2011_GWA2_40_7]KKR92259.1 MAG: Glycosyl transferase group 1 [Candidatus Woesebacteria bacterium GW2011_GWA1_41_13b]
MKKLKIAIVHDYLKEYGGAERVVEAMLEIWPDAPVYTTVFLPEFLGPHRTRVEKWDIRTSFLQKIPFNAKLISLFRFIAPFVFSTMDLTKYDVVVVSSAGTYTSPNFIRMNKKSTLVCYYHTPPRYLYGYPVANDWRNNIFRRMLLALGQIPMFFLRILDKRAAQIPDYVLANSKEVAGRIRRFYNREATVIYPPVEIPKLEIRNSKSETRNYYLIGSRVSRHKGHDIAIKAFTKLGYKLNVFGGTFASYGLDQFKKDAGANIKFLGEVTEDEKLDLMKNAKAFIYPSEHEDFGIVPVETMAAGTPVIALAQGGPLETIIDGKTGVFFKERTIESLIAAVKKSEKMKFKSEDCVSQAKKFSKERFKREMLQFVDTHAQNEK